MAIYRIKRLRDFVVLPNALVQNKALSYKARGLLTYLLSKPEDWTVQFQDLVTAQDGKDGVRSGLKELRLAGYIQWRPVHNAQGHRSWEYHVYDTPQPAKTEKPYTEKPYTEKPDVDYITDNTVGSMNGQQEEIFDEHQHQSDFPTNDAPPYTEKPYTEKPDTYKELILQRTEENNILPHSQNGAVSRGGKYSQGFEDFWHTWQPSSRKDKKTACFALWKRRKLEPRAQEICQKVGQWWQTRKWRDGFEPGVHPWLYQYQYDDEVPGPEVARRRSEHDGHRIANYPSGKYCHDCQREVGARELVN